MTNEILKKKIEEQILDSYEIMYQFVSNYIHNENDALEIVLESVDKAIKSSGSLKEETAVRPWLGCILRSTAEEYVRRSSC